MMIYSYTCPLSSFWQMLFISPHLSSCFPPFSSCLSLWLPVLSFYCTGRLPDFSNYHVIITLTFLPLSHIHFSGSIFDDQWAWASSLQHLSPHYLLLPQSNPSHVFNFLPLLCFLELILHLRWSRSYLKSTPTDTWHLPLDKDHQGDNCCNYPWLFLSSFCTNTSYSY